MWKPVEKQLLESLVNKGFQGGAKKGGTVFFCTPAFSARK
jgi:hypothetical protein